MQTWVGNDDFLFCHWIAECEEDVYRQLDAFDLEGKVVSSMTNEVFQFMSAYRDSNQILRQYPENGDKWCSHHPDLIQEITLYKTGRFFGHLTLPQM